MKKIFFLAMTSLLCQYTYAQTLVWEKSGHPNNQAVNGVAFSANGNTILSGTECDSARLRLFSKTDGSIVWDYLVNPSSLMCQMGVQQSSNGNFFASVEEMGNLLIFDNSGSSPVLSQTINIGSNASTSLAISPSGNAIAVDGADDSVRIFTVSNGALAHTMGAHPGGVLTVAYNLSGTLLASGGADDKIKIWNPSTGALIATLTGHSDEVVSLKFSSDNMHLISVAKNGQVKIWMEMGGMWMAHYTFLSGENAKQIDISDDGNYILIGGVSKARVFRFSNQSLAGEFNVTGGGAVNGVDFEPAAKKVALGTANGKVSYWNLEALLSVNDLSMEAIGLNLFPNPTSDFIQLKLDAAYSTLAYKIVDMAGKEIQSGQIVNGEKIDVSILSSGYYLLKVSSNNKAGFVSFEKR
jgi:WD40 repeat protein